MQNTRHPRIFSRVRLCLSKQTRTGRVGAAVTQYIALAPTSPHLLHCRSNATNPGLVWGGVIITKRVLALLVEAHMEKIHRCLVFCIQLERSRDLEYDDLDVYVHHIVV